MMPGMPGMSKRARGRQAPKAKKGKGARRSGNPAKAAAQAARVDQPSAGADAFGLGGQGIPDDFDPSQLPDLSKFLK